MEGRVRRRANHPESLRSPGPFGARFRVVLQEKLDSRERHADAVHPRASRTASEEGIDFVDARVAAESPLRRLYVGDRRPDLEPGENPEFFVGDFWM